MDKFPDKDIDYIFREGSEKHDFPFKESAWDNMDALLDQEVKKRQWKRWLLLLLLFITITGGGVVGYWLLTPPNTTPDTFIKHTPVNTEKEKIDFAENTTATSDNRIVDLTTRNEKSKLIDTNKNVFKAQQNKAKIKQVISKQSVSTPTNKDNTITNYNTTATALTTLDLATTKINPVKSTNTTSNKRPTNTEIQRTIFNLEPIATSSLQAFSVDDTFDDKTLPSLDLKELRQDNLKVGLVIGREWSSVGMMTDSKKGYRLGLELVYQFKNRFQISTGFIASKKKYETQGTNYNARVARWVDEAAPQTVQGSCDIFEIPLDFAYYFKGYEASSFFVNGGFNSYIMRKEWYDYEYESGTNMQGLPTYWTGNMKNNHVLSVTNFSIGYQQILNDKMTVQLAPYIQVPLTGIGDGQVKLYTTGLQMKMFFGK